MQNCAIIGSGVAGLATSIRLAAAGYKVTVYESNSYVGGKLSAFIKDGFHFDAGPSLFTEPQNIEELFELSKKNINDYFSYIKSPISCNYFFANGKQISCSENIEVFAHDMQEKIGEPKENILNYLQKAKNAYEKIGTLFLNYELTLNKQLLSANIKNAILNTKPAYLFKTLNEYNSSFFKKPETVQLFNRYATYNGSNPYKAPAMLSMIPHLEFNQGTFYPRGGMINITNALEKLAKDLGVHFKLNSKVTEIKTKNNKVESIVSNGETIPYDIVVSNADVYYTYLNLLKNEKAAKNVLRQERSSSAFIFYWGIKKVFKQLHLHNIFFSDNYKKEFEEIFKLNELPSQPTIYVNITSKFDREHAPENCENWFVMINAPAHDNQNWKIQAQKLKNLVIKIISKHLNEDIEPLIATEETLHPLDIQEKTSSYKGSLYGTSSNSKMAAFFRHKNHVKEYDNLYFCGGSVHPGGGIPLCLRSAKLVVNKIIDKQNGINSKK